ncbi:hypothetical protein SNE40_022574 [Patella caerulea]|uniref:GATOR2 complex protein WDR24 n=1 Tax=Patella caerulea TaxID=87958 RepID=A0AAN8J3Y6_PATCE
MQQFVHDKVNYTKPEHHMSFNCEGPANALALNKDATMCVVAGRTVFRIVGIEDHGFVDRINLRVGKINLNYCAADVAWNHHDENILASAATNGSVVIWNLNKPNRSKQECVLTDHKRTVNRVIFHKADASILLSGSQDGTMKLFDIRKHAVSLTFTGKMSESVRDIQFCPHIGSGYFMFAAAYDNGNIQLWDMRRQDRCIKQFPAHTGPAFSLDWHPEEKDWLATAGRDKMIKVWDTTQNPERMIKSVQTIASVARVKWRPQRKLHLASASLLLDHHVNVWALGRPYIPFATFDGHKDVVSSIVWLDTHIFFTCGKDGYLVQHSFKDAKRPADSVIPSGVDMDLFGHVSHAFGERTGFKKASQAGRSFLFFSKAPDKGDLFTESRSDMYVHTTKHNLTLPFEGFIESAKRYKLSNSSFDALCDHNADVARRLNRPKVSSCWSVLHVLFCNKHLSHSITSRTNSVAPNDKQDNNKGTGKSQLNSTQDMNKVNVKDSTSDDSDGESSELDNKLLVDSGLLYQQADFFFGDGETDGLDYDNPTSSFDMLTKVDDDLLDYKLPYEAIQVRHELKTVSPEDLEAGHQTLVGEQKHNNMTDNQISPSEPEDENIISIPSKLDIPRISQPQIVVDMLKTFAQQGDIQSTVSMLIVLGDKIRQYIDEEVQEAWFQSYIEILGYYELWTVSAEIIKLCHIGQVSSLNQQSTTIHTYCSQCSRQILGKVGWLCEKCKSVTNSCSICHLPVRHMYIWCQGCCHGGHIDHIKDWFAVNNECPTGCGHMCQYT